MFKIDMQALKDDKALNDLSWEIIEARGFHVGDLVALWDLACGLIMSANELKKNAADIDMASELQGWDPTLDYTARAFEMLSSLMNRDASEILIFIMSRGFEIPREYIL